jgi:prephenate dehydratase
VTPEVRHTPRLGFLGPRGTFTEQALSTQADLTDMDLVTMPTMPDVLIAVDDNALDLGFVAIENAIEGTVNVTIDTLAFDVDLVIQREVVIPVEMCLLVKPGTRLDQIREIVSFGHASAQCRRWLRANLPNAEIQTARSTAEGAESVAVAASNTIAAIANSLAAATYGLEILASGIEDHPENSTRFVVVSKGVIPPPSGHDKTTVVVYQRADKPGSLLAILQEFAARSINLTLLLSRPTKRSLGEYCFVLDLEGHIADPVIGDCLRTLHATQGGIKFLGSYPAGTKGSEHRRQESADAVTQADEWLSGLRERIA